MTAVTFQKKHDILCVTAQDETSNALETIASYCPNDLDVVVAGSATEAVELAAVAKRRHQSFQVCLVDFRLPDQPRSELLREIHMTFPRMATALIAGPDELEAAVQAVKDERADRVIPRSHGCESEWSNHLEALLAHAAYLERLHIRLAGMRDKHLFVTGGTGFLGTRFLRDLLRCADVRVTALARTRKGVPHDRRLPFGEREFPERLRFVEGDVRETDLGLSETEREELHASVDEVWHLAALTTFDEAMRDATFAVNLTGTINTLQFARRVRKLEYFNHVSTAYVCGSGDYAHAIPEQVGARPAGFRNPYEESKYLAELEVVNAGLPFLIYRPSIILGETVSGRCDGQTVYNIAKMVRLAKLLGEQDCMERGLPLDYHSLRVAANTESRKNLIAVDQVIETMLGIRASRPEPGTVFHVTHPQPVAIGDLVETIARLLDANHYEIVDSLDGLELSVPEMALERVAGIFRPYMLTSDPIFDTTNTRKALGSPSPAPISVEQLAFYMDAFYTQYFGSRYRETAIEA